MLKKKDVIPGMPESPFSVVLSEQLANQTSNLLKLGVGRMGTSNFSCSAGTAELQGKENHNLELQLFLWNITVELNTNEGKSEVAENLTSIFSNSAGTAELGGWEKYNPEIQYF